MGHGENINFFKAAKGLKSWLVTLDHKRIGIMYLFSVFFALFLGGVFALLLRTELLLPTKIFMTAKQYNQAFTLHGAIMVFLFIIPSIPGALGNFLLPIQLGAKDVAFPRLNLSSYYFYVAGALIAILSLVLGAVDTGWTFYTPYSITTDTSVLLMAFSAFILGFSSMFTGINFIATIHKMRAPGMTWFKMPLFIWAMYATSIIQILATPVIGITVLLLFMERVIGVGIFNPALGGDPVLFQHFFWFYSHPAVYIMVLPAMGIMSELVTTFCKKDIFGYKTVAYSSIAIALISFFVWGHHLFASSQSDLANYIFSLLTFLVGIPSGIKVFNWVATMYKGTIDFKTPFLYFLAFILLFCIGGFTGIMLAVLSLDVYYHDTYFVVAHFHYTMVGGVVMAFLGGTLYWWPKMFGKMYNELWAKISFFFIFIGFNVTFMSQFIMGSNGMPRRYYTYLEQFKPYHQVSTLGAFILGIGLLILAITLFVSLRRGQKAPDNPWGGTTLEWKTSSPPPLFNFTEDPVITAKPYDYETRKG